MTLEIGMHCNGLGGSQATPEIGQHQVAFGQATELDSTVFKFGNASMKFVDSPISYLKLFARKREEPREWLIEPGSPKFSFECWVRFANITESQTIFAFDLAGATEARNYGYRLRWDPLFGGVFQWIYNGTYSSRTTLSSSLFIPVVGTWYFLSLQRGEADDPDDFTLRLKIDAGATILTHSGTVYKGPLDTDLVDFYIGNRDDGSEPFIGWLDDIRYTKLSATQDASPTLPVAEFDPPDLPGADTVIFPSTLVGKGSFPTDAGDLWEPASWILANWVESVRMDEAFNTRINQALTDAEKRTQLLDRPFRTLEVTLNGMAQAQTHALGNMMMRWAEARTLVPVYMDRSKLTAAAASGQPIISCDTTLRRFYIGQRILIAGNQQRCELVDTEVGQIQSFTDTTITLEDNLASAFKVNALVYPLMECKVLLDSDRVRLTGHLAQARLRFLETEGRTAMPPLIDLDEVPAGVEIYQNFPVFKWTLQSDATEQIRRSGQEITSGRGTITETFGPRAKFGFAGDVCMLDRAAVWEFLEFFHGRGGRTCVFWVASSFSEYELLEVNANNIKVGIVGEVNDWDFRPYFALVEHDGTITIREIASVVRAGDGDVLQFTEAISIAIGDVRRTARAGLSRFNLDEFSERWQSDQALRGRIEHIETLEEKSINAGIEYLPTPPSEVCTEAQDVICDDCVNSDPESDPLDDRSPNADGEGNPV